MEQSGHGLNSPIPSSTLHTVLPYHEALSIPLWPLWTKRLSLSGFGQSRGCEE